MKKWFLFFLIAVATHLALPVSAQYVNLLDNTVSAAVDNLVKKSIADNNLPGVAIGIVYDGQIVYTNGYGWAKRDKTLMSASTVMRWGSISKSVTGVLAMKLVEKGDIDLDDFVKDYVPEYDHKDVTIRHLLSHQSGTRHYDDDCTFGPIYTGAFNATKSLNIVGKCDLLFTPGTDTHYSTFGSILLGVVIDRVGKDVYGKGYEGLFTDWVKNKAVLESMQADNNNTIPNMATGYDPLNTPTKSVPHVGWRLPGGGFASSVYDLTRFMLGLMNRQFINAATSNTMWTAQTLEDGTATDFGLGVKIDNSSGDLGVWHNGTSSNMSNTLMDFFPNQRLGIVIMSNDGRSGKDGFKAIRELKEDLLDLVRCPTSRSFVGSGGIYGRDLHYEASNSIEAALFEIADSKVVFDAGSSIRLKPGFKAREGAQFKAIIDGCGGITTPAIPGLARTFSEPDTSSGHQPASPKKASILPEQSPPSTLVSIGPNPFTEMVEIKYVVKQPANVDLIIFNMQGNPVKKPVAKAWQTAGVHQLEIDAHDLPPGLYFYHLQIGTEKATGTIIRK